MNATFINHTEFAEIITSESCVIHSTINAPEAPEMHVATVDGVDVLIFVDAAGGAAVVQGCHLDHESGGSIHSHARAINAAA
ncbi:hypothetical protein ACHAC9_16890 [Massilia sp. CMS3.1]|uniref:hypothetical protein n=1 Tax=Massilia sp. CMS3.1 TaxID=3373083 RepID=UPI003EE42F1C